MKILLYSALKTNTKIDKVLRHLEKGDFRSADVKKIGDNLYRAKVDDAG